LFRQLILGILAVHVASKHFVINNVVPKDSTTEDHPPVPASSPGFALYPLSRSFLMPNAIQE
jgi:hypothetical protein